MKEKRVKVKIKKGDTVIFVAGKDYNIFAKKGRGEKATVERVPHRGKVIEVSRTKGKVKVEGAGIIKKHEKANRAANKPGGIIEKEMWVDISNVMVVDPESGKPTKVKTKVNDDGTKTRVTARSDRELS
jgi:large subunit ribosomal protein L24